MKYVKIFSVLLRIVSILALIIATGFIHLHKQTLSKDYILIIIGIAMFLSFASGYFTGRIDQNKEQESIPEKYKKAYEYLSNLNEQVQEHGEIKMGKNHFYWSIIAELFKDKKTP